MDRGVGVSSHHDSEHKANTTHSLVDNRQGLDDEGRERGEVSNETDVQNGDVQLPRVSHGHGDNVHGYDRVSGDGHGHHVKGYDDYGREFVEMEDEGKNGDMHLHRDEHQINQKLEILSGKSPVDLDLGLNLSVSNFGKIITSLLAGAIAGAVAKTVIAPLDRTKINFQVKSEPFSLYKAWLFIRATYRNDGVLMLWRGNSATLVRIIPYAAIQFTAHEQYKGYLLHKGGKKYLNLRENLFCGSLAGATATTLVYPLDFSRARMAVTPKSKYKSIFHVFKNVAREEGIRAIYRGYSPSVIGSCCYSGIGFGTNETLKRYHAQYFRGRDLHWLERMVCGGIAGLCGQVVSYPLEICRRRMQTAGVTGHSADYTSIYRTAKHIITKEGFRRGMYKGLSMNFIKGPIATGLAFMIHGLVSKWTRRHPLFHIDKGR